MKDEVRQGTGLTVSAGVADCKMAAKIASDLGKPDGLVTVPPGGTAAFLAPLPVSRLWGVGRVTEQALRALGIATIGELARFPEQVLVERFGSQGAHMRALARGDDPRPVVPDEEARSVGAEDTFERDLLGEEALLPQLLDQCVRVARRLREAGLRGRVVTLKVKFADFEQLTRRSTLPRPTDDGGEIYRSIREDLGRAGLDRPVRLTGVTVSGFDAEEGAPDQLGLFGARARRSAPREGQGKRDALNAALDALADRFGEGAVKPATLAEREPETLRARIRWPTRGGKGGAGVARTAGASAPCRGAARGRPAPRRPGPPGRTGTAVRQRAGVVEHAPRPSRSRRARAPPRRCRPADGRRSSSGSGRRRSWRGARARATATRPRSSCTSATAASTTPGTRAFRVKARRPRRPERAAKAAQAAQASTAQRTTEWANRTMGNMGGLGILLR